MFNRDFSGSWDQELLWSSNKLRYRDMDSRLGFQESIGKDCTLSILVPLALRALRNREVVVVAQILQGLELGL